MPRKWGPCAEPRCPTLTEETYCAAHRPAPWATSDRRARLPADWARRRRSVFRLYGRYCYLCGAYARAIDHIVAGDNHDITNLAPICDDCHEQKTIQERRTHG